MHIHFVNKRERILKRQSKIDIQEKLATKCTQDENKQNIEKQLYAS